ncbi:GNAT family N-acetyltransferase [uncultured Mucilaginibacter sp.]|uniref:GNAT family N-acetyltransferase n=1 Tax=uncultured Mucilaginibacter sp. TaxID=797541 RepID=UPI0025DF1945|nr:GNAT family N-acetyltransferase [uncultured Mucilaginibacter sp.]
MNKVIMNDEVFIKKGFFISTDNSLLDFDNVYRYLNEDSYWAKGITKEKLLRAIDNSLCFGVYHDKKQIGFARLITDKATFAYLADVFILDAYRSQGLSKWLMQTIMSHPEVQGLRRWVLATADAHGLYKQFGFGPLAKPDRWMDIFTPYPVPEGQE